MYVVECPHCHRQFRVAEPVAKARMRCTKCNQQFIGSSVAVPDEMAQGTFQPAGQDSSSPPPTPAARAAARRQARSQSGPVMLVVCCLGAAGIIVLAVAFVWIRTHPKVIVQTHQPEQQIRRRPEADDGNGGRFSPGQTPPAPRPGPRGPVPPRPRVSRPGQTPVQVPAQGLRDDPNLMVSSPTFVDAGVTGETLVACGRVLSKYAVPLQHVTVTMYVGDRQGPSAGYPWVPANGSVKFSLPVPGGQASRSRVRLVASGTRAARGVVVWSIPPTEIRRLSEDDETVWTGNVRNAGSVPVRKVRIILDYYDADGLHGGRAEGKLTQPASGRLGAGSRGHFRVTTTDLNAASLPDTGYSLWARAVGEPD